MAGTIRIGTAGWSLAPGEQHRFPAGASHLQRYAQVFEACEINSSFHRPHRAATWARWAAEVPDGFAFSAKLPREITHERRLVDCEAPLRSFLDAAGALGDRLRALLVQLPPSLAFDAPTADAFFAALHGLHPAPAVLEPRHASWFTPAVDAWLAQRRIARVLADPVRHAPGRWPGGWPQCVYLRLHGWPRVYTSPYPEATLLALAQRLRLAADEGRDAWCIFDNTARGAATGDALRLRELLAQT
ncbi:MULTISPECIES: DUF72 domain-containing protein [Ramlibacter]|uniref:DUF72 domain-containing protein n=1 Tax=Ramlibacter pinisoli TaxID=2682844 RepID=A0A6N8J3U9_9BURK|nr:DUF72 domain-containing protein [Ramlibacter sp. CGMCC 1.13660]MVQ33010.1 DUF72 domain-containing protein [Ramlibacter pinisoli]